jgi:ABC transport system ATP-binding/permease protein
LIPKKNPTANLTRSCRRKNAGSVRGIKARRTRNEGRVRALKAMRQERAARRERTGQANLTVQQSDAPASWLSKPRVLSATFAGQTLFNDFSITLQRGDRIGLIGPNGCGKSTC